MTNAVSVKDKLKNKSIETGKTLQELLVLYGIERTIYRLSISRFKDSFVLKGGILLYACFDGAYARATTDIDLFASNISNDIDQMKEIFSGIFGIEADDPLVFDLRTLSVRSICEFKKYHGVNINIVAFLDKTRIPISIDVGFGDVIVPGRVKMDYPVIIDDENPFVYAYSLSSLIAEKFETIVSLGYDNSRLKDYYDIYVLSVSHDFYGNELKEAIRETFENRRSSISEIVAFEDGFGEDPVRRMRWQAFIKKKKAMLPVNLEETIDMIKSFLGPIVKAIINNTDAEMTWDHEKRNWINC